MKTTLDIPDEVASEVRRQAEKLGLQIDVQIVLLLRMGLLFGEIGGQLDLFVRAIAEARHRLRPPDVAQSGDVGNSLNVQIDPVTRLPVIISPPDCAGLFPGCRHSPGDRTGGVSGGRP